MTMLDKLMSIRREDVRFTYRDQQTMLYAIGIGMGRDPLDEQELSFVAEGNGEPKTIATMASVLTSFDALRTSGIDYSKVLHTDQRLTIHRPLPGAANIIADYGIIAVLDKGAERGIFVQTQTKVRTAEDDQPLFTASGTILARGDGGIGSSGTLSPSIQPPPDRPADFVDIFKTRPDQALLYRLNGDRNPLHSSPATAQRVGFDRPILHGLCTYGIACRAILATVCNYDHTLIGSFDVKFSSPVYPGETIATDIWVDEPVASFRCRVLERDITAINNGVCILRRRS